MCTAAWPTVLSGIRPSPTYSPSAMAWSCGCRRMLTQPKRSPLRSAAVLIRQRLPGSFRARDTSVNGTPTRPTRPVPAVAVRGRRPGSAALDPADPPRRSRLVRVPGRRRARRPGCSADRQHGGRATAARERAIGSRWRRIAAEAGMVLVTHSVTGKRNLGPRLRRLCPDHDGRSSAARTSGHNGVGYDVRPTSKTEVE
jgi:hypothetical protein